MQAIMRYDLEIDDIFNKSPRTSITIDLPAGSTVVAVGTEKFNEAFLWAQVNTEAALKPQTFQVRNTGESLQGVGRYLGSVVVAWKMRHLFEDPGNG